MGGQSMQISEKTIEKINSLSDEKQEIIISLIEQFSTTPLEVLEKLRVQGLKNPMEMDEINSFIKETRTEQC